MGVVVLFVQDSSMDGMPYSTLSAKSSGSLAAYLLLEELGFKLDRHEEEIGLLPTEHITLLIINHPSRNISRDDWALILEWVLRGNQLVIAGSKDFLNDLNAEPVYALLVGNNTEDGHGSFIYEDILHGDGKIRIIPNHRILSNRLLKSRGNATKLVSVLWDFKDQKIVFYEKWDRGQRTLIAEDKRGLTGAFLFLPMTARYIMLQLLIGLVLFLVLTNIRIGPPIVVRELQKRQDNENIIAVAGLMNRFKLYDSAFNLYMNDFVEDLSKYFKVILSSDILKVWREKGLKYEDQLREILHHHNKVKGLKFSEGDMLRLIKVMDQIREELCIVRGVRKQWIKS